MKAFIKLFIPPILLNIFRLLKHLLCLLYKKRSKEENETTNEHSSTENRYTTNGYIATLIERSQKNGFLDVNDSLEVGSDTLATRITKQIFSYNLIDKDMGEILEVGAGTGRFTREIVKYIPALWNITCLEYGKDEATFLKEYLEKSNILNTRVIHGDYFNNKFPNKHFDIIMLPWFVPLSLYKWGEVMREASRMLKTDGLLIFDFMDSQDSLLDVISNPANSPYFMANGSDLDKIGHHLGFFKKVDFSIKFNGLFEKTVVYKKVD